MKSKSRSNEQKNSCCLCRTKLPDEEGSKEDLERLRHFVQKGKGWSMGILAGRYKDGAGGTQSWEQAAHFYKMAVKHGNVGSMVHLGILYMTGHGVEQEGVLGFKSVSDAGFLVLCTSINCPFRN